MKNNINNNINKTSHIEGAGSAYKYLSKIIQKIENRMEEAQKTQHDETGYKKTLESIYKIICSISFDFDTLPQAIDGVIAELDQIMTTGGLSIEKKYFIDALNKVKKANSVVSTRQNHQN